MNMFATCFFDLAPKFLRLAVVFLQMGKLSHAGNTVLKFSPSSLSFNWGASICYETTKMSKSTCTVLKKMSKNLFHESWTPLSHSSNILKIRGLSVLRRIFVVSLLLVSWLLVYLPLVLFHLSSKRSECYSFFQLNVKGQRAFPGL